MGKKHKKQSDGESESVSEQNSNGEQKKENFYVFDSSLKDIFQSGASSTFTISGISGPDEIKAEPESKKVTKQYSKDGEDIVKKKQAKKVPSWKEHFFFLPDDPRFAEGLQFFGSAQVPKSAAFSDLRKNLKGLVRHKISKNKTLKIKRKIGKKNWKKNRLIKGK